MYIYLIVFLILLFGALLELFSKIHLKILYKLYFLILGGLLICRYGQGTDFFNYQLIYDALPPLSFFSPFTLIKELNSLPIHSEIGWKLLCTLAKTCSISFTQFVIGLSVVELILLRRFIKLFCPYPLLALFLLFPTCYLTYMFSAFRQGLVMLAFLAILFPWLLQRKMGRFLIGCLLLTTIHRMAWAFLAAPLFLRIKYNKGFQWLIAGSFIIGIVLEISGLINYVTANIELLVEESAFSLIAVAERIFSYVVVVSLFYQYKKRKPITPLLSDCIKLYAYGTLLYGLFCAQALWASRLSYPLKVLEIVLLCHFIQYPKLKIPFALYFIPLSILMYFKNIQSYISQGNYSYFVNIFNFPYVSIFNSSKILWLRWIKFDWPT